MTDLPPPLPAPSGELTVPGFAIGHGSDLRGKTGVTVVLCPPQGALAAAEVRGSATGTRQFDSLVLGHHVASRAHAVVLAGGSGFGLAAADPVVQHLERDGRGFQTGVAVVPLVPTAILFDLGFGDPTARPHRALGRSPGPVRAGLLGHGLTSCYDAATATDGRGRGCAPGRARPYPWPIQPTRPPVGRP